MICKDQQAAAVTAAGPPQQAPTDSGLPTRKHKLQIIQALRHESSTESETQSYTEFRGWVNLIKYLRPPELNDKGDKGSRIAEDVLCGGQGEKVVIWLRKVSTGEEGQSTGEVQFNP